MGSCRAVRRAVLWAVAPATCRAGGRLQADRSRALRRPCLAGDCPRWRPATGPCKTLLEQGSRPIGRPARVSRSYHVASQSSFMTLLPRIMVFALTRRQRECPPRPPANSSCQGRRPPGCSRRPRGPTDVIVASDTGRDVLIDRREGPNTRSSTQARPAARSSSRSRRL
jgi:hypothetical protein